MWIGSLIVPLRIDRSVPCLLDGGCRLTCGLPDDVEHDKREQREWCRRFHRARDNRPPEAPIILGTSELLRSGGPGIGRKAGDRIDRAIVNFFG